MEKQGKPNLKRGLEMERNLDLPRGLRISKLPYIK